jgi:protein-tyrosine phosphatase
VYLGCELHLTPENLHAALDDPTTFTLNGKHCLLVELPDSIVPHVVDSSLRILVDSGLVPIIAHAERNLYIQRHLPYASHLVSFGCFLQLTASSFFGAFGSGAAQATEHLIAHRMAHFVASDAHGFEQRRPLLAGACRHVERKFGEAAARLLFLDNPRAAIEGSPISSISQPRRSALARFFGDKSDAKLNQRDLDSVLVKS